MRCGTAPSTAEENDRAPSSIRMRPLSQEDQSSRRRGPTRLRWGRPSVRFYEPPFCCERIASTSAVPGDRLYRSDGVVAAPSASALQDAREAAVSLSLSAGCLTVAATSALRAGSEYAPTHVLAGVLLEVSFEMAARHEQGNGCRRTEAAVSDRPSQTFAPPLMQPPPRTRVRLLEPAESSALSPRPPQALDRAVCPFDPALLLSSRAPESS